MPRKGHRPLKPITGIIKPRPPPKSEHSKIKLTCCSDAGNISNEFTGCAGQISHQQEGNRRSAEAGVPSTMKKKIRFDFSNSGIDVDEIINMASSPITQNILSAANLTKDFNRCRDDCGCSPDVPGGIPGEEEASSRNKSKIQYSP